MLKKSVFGAVFSLCFQVGSGLLKNGPLLGGDGFYLRPSKKPIRFFEGLQKNRFGFFGGALRGRCGRPRATRGGLVFGAAGGSRPGAPACWRGACAGGFLRRFALAVLRAGCWRLSISDLASFVVRFALASFEKKTTCLMKCACSNGLKS